VSVRGNADEALNWQRERVYAWKRVREEGAGYGPFFISSDVADRVCSKLKIVRLEISNLRVLRELVLEPGPAMNFIVGANGAGKTSILEGIYLAGRGRSFRHAESGPLIRNDAGSSTVIVHIDRGNGARASILGLRREKSAIVCRMDGKDLNKRSDLAEALPVQWVGSQPQVFLEQGPDVRRRFLDMGLFHVEHSYLHIVSELQRVLRQRNAALRSGDAEMASIWDKPLELVSDQVNEARSRFVESLMPNVISLLSDWSQDFDFSYRYRSGWHTDKPLSELLKRKIGIDLKMGFTGIGPHRAELALFSDGLPVEKKLSRGQQKMLLLALNIALLDLSRSRTTWSPILLVDDLAAELDETNRSRVLRSLVERETQAFLTKIDDSALRVDSVDNRTFHVEHGALK
jgi:DNA replication and repair protein RecF